MRLLSVLCLAAGLLCAGCGDDEKPSSAAKPTTTTTAEQTPAGPKKLNPAYGTFVAATRLNAAKACVQRLKNGAETAKLHLALSRGADNLIKLARQQPDALYEPGGDEDPVTMRQVLSDLASDNEACNPQLSRKLDRAVDTLPAAP